MPIPTTTPAPTTTITPVPTTTLYPPITTTTSQPTTTTPDPDQYICVYQAPFAGTYEKSDWQYNDKPQWSKLVGSTNYWVYFHETDGWSVTDNPVAPNIWKSSELSAAKPWNVSSF